jgi:hypothetical protein
MRWRSRQIRRRWATMERVRLVRVVLSSERWERESRRLFWDWAWDWRPLCIDSLRREMDVFKDWTFLRAAWIRINRRDDADAGSGGREGGLGVDWEWYQFGDVFVRIGGRVVFVRGILWLRRFGASIEFDLVVVKVVRCGVLFLRGIGLCLELHLPMFSTLTLSNTNMSCPTVINTLDIVAEVLLLLNPLVEGEDGGVLRHR